MTTEIPVSSLTQATVSGTGVFDVLMRATKAHLEQEFAKNRIKGSEYATVYLGALEQTMQTALAFLLQNQKIALEAQLLEQQIILAGVEVEKAQAELAIIAANLAKVPLEIAHLQAQTALTEAQTANAEAELQIILQNALKIPAEIALIEQQTANLVSEELLIDAKVSLTTQQAANAVIEGTVLTAQECKLRAEYDVLMLQKAKVSAETSLLAQKGATEKAQITTLGVDADSVIGRQKALYKAQTDGFLRDAEQKAAKLLVDSWSVRRSTDEGTVADATNKLDDTTVGRAVTKLLTGVGA